MVTFKREGGAKNGLRRFLGAPALSAEMYDLSPLIFSLSRFCKPCF